MNRTDLLNRLRRAEARMDAARSDSEYEAARELYVTARSDLEKFTKVKK
jgi:hypothetical protein